MPRSLLFFGFVFLVAGCASGGQLTPDGGPVLVDGAIPSPPDGGLVGPDVGPSLQQCEPGCGTTELCGAMSDGDGNDDDCDGTVDEGCACPAINVTRPCFPGPPDRRGVGTCADGVMGCTEFLTWSACTGGQFPAAESCDGADNDCNGVIDDGLASCATSVMCPSTQVASPLNDFALSAATIFTGTATAYRWTVTCPSTVTPCPVPKDPTARDTSIYFVQSGSYRTRLEIDAGGTTPIACEWVVNVAGSGLRVELQWDTQGEGRGNTDVDLHLHRRSSTAGPETAFFTDDDCYYGNCKSRSQDYDPIADRWALPDTSDVSACNSAPHGEGAEWATRGSCGNPRLDVDVIYCNPTVTDPAASDFCAPENINIDNPPIGEPYRILVNYFSAASFTGETHPTVNVFCNGEQRGTFTPPAPLRNGSSGYDTNDSWLVADVVFEPGACGEIECRILPLGMIQQTDAFGPPWTL